eukprot:CAMPEP_0170200270 /NCGR_PEP_ID=MMETSP0040_2-20121228/69784_1 /TAXON_ID=641309 /ORGANISM="Lotharella oceanica, Strain CCMP622" /LENGTH=95 /DNA_ID=CAMNT_0010450449 /DNA_START=183 /DNA_END=470 /DNA_ORIENTATION=-
MILDIGCGSGLSGMVLSKHGVRWIGFDVSLPMLRQAQERQVEGDVLLADMGMGLPFRKGVFDASKLRGLMYSTGQCFHRYFLPPMAFFLKFRRKL